MTRAMVLPTPSSDSRVVIRTARSGGVWHVTQNDIFLGDYLSEEPARNAARAAGREIERLGGRVDLVLGTLRQGVIPADNSHRRRK